MAEHQVLVELGAVLAVEVDVEELARPQRLRHAVHHVQVGHLLVPDLRVHPHHLRVRQLLDERQRVPDGRQQDVAARLVGLGLDGEPQVVAAVEHEAAQQVHRLAVAVERGPDVLGRVVLAALATAPQHERLRAELGGQLDVAQHLPQREPAHGAVVAGEATVLEHGVGEQVGGDHRDGHPGLAQRVLQPGDLLVARARVREEAEQVVVVEGEAPRAQLGQPVHGLDDVQRRPRGLAERVHRPPADGPEPEREVVGGGRSGGHGALPIFDGT